MSKHTPGPWKVDYSETGVRWPTVIAPDEPGFDDGSPVEVCDISISYPIDAGADCPERIEAEANAHLMAAAPDYDTVARFIVNVAIATSPGDSISGVVITDKAYSMLCDAIAKVEGTEHE